MYLTDSSKVSHFVLDMHLVVRLVTMCLTDSSKVSHVVLDIQLVVRLVTMCSTERQLVTVCMSDRASRKVRHDVLD